MVTATPYIARVEKKFSKTITFDGAAGSGAVGTVAVATITGSVIFRWLSVRCITSLAGATSTVELGTANNTAGLIAQTTGTEIDDGEWWQDSTPETEISPAIKDQMVEGNLIITVGTAAVSAGALEIVGYWHPVSDDGNVA